MAGGSSRRYPPELRERVVRMVAEISGQRDSEWAAISEVARLLGVGCAETVRKWVRQAPRQSCTSRGSAGDSATAPSRCHRRHSDRHWTASVIRLAVLSVASGGGRGSPHTRRRGWPSMTSDAEMSTHVYACAGSPPRAHIIPTCRRCVPCVDTQVSELAPV